MTLHCITPDLHDSFMLPLPSVRIWVCNLQCCLPGKAYTFSSCHSNSFFLLSLSILYHKTPKNWPSRDITFRRICIYVYIHAHRCGWGEGEKLNRQNGEFAMRLNHVNVALKGSLSVMGRGESHERPSINNFCHFIPTSELLQLPFPHLELPSSRLLHIYCIALMSQTKCHLLREIFPDYLIYLK